MTNFTEEFTDDNVPSNDYFKFDKIGDFIKGTFVGKELKPAKGIYEAQWLYELTNCETHEGKIEGSCFAPIKVSKKYVLDRVKNAKVGQRIGFRYESDYDSGKGNPSKSLKPFMWGMDEEYLKLNQVTETFGGEEISSNPF